MPLRPQPWLLPLSWLYGAVLRWRNARFDRSSPRRLPVPVLSVGNLSVGGTGKTPLILWLVGRLRAAGLRPGVLARGYGRLAGEELNDEGRLLAARYPDLPQEQDPDRFAAGQRLLAREDCDLLLLDDGFQHRRLHRDIDLCVLDAKAPFASGRLLPAGLLREGPSGLKRATVVVLNSSEPLAEERMLAGESELRPHLREDTPVYRSRLRPSFVRMLPEGRELPASEALAGRRVLLLAGIARPERFVQLVTELGAELVAQHLVGDHRHVPAEDLARWSREAEQAGALLLWTEKDEARHQLGAQSGPARGVLHGEIEFLGPEPDPAAWIAALTGAAAHGS
ncbi:MAG: tetraacyldisaccharide 4'-kinase [Planctomycetota bacterium]|nr:MAG: tetraacyldisaccharide 4'-kinase [Planctomycetota bacterium]